MKRNTIEEIENKIIEQYGLIANPHGAYIYESYSTKHTVSLKYLIRDAIMAGIADENKAMREYAKSYHKAEIAKSIKMWESFKDPHQTRTITIDQLLEILNKDI